MTTITLSTCVLYVRNSNIVCEFVGRVKVKAQTWCSYGYGYERLMIVFRTISSNGVF